MRPHPRRTRTDPSRPQAWGTDDRSGFVGQHRDLRWQMEWAGTKLVKTGILVFEDEYDAPQPQLSTLMLPVDPPSTINARVERYSIDEYPVSTLATESGAVLVIGYTPYPTEIIVDVAGNLT